MRELAKQWNEMDLDRTPRCLGLQHENSDNLPRFMQPPSTQRRPQPWPWQATSLHQVEGFVRDHTAKDAAQCWFLTYD